MHPLATRINIFVVIHTFVENEVLYISGCTKKSYLILFDNEYVDIYKGSIFGR